MAGVKKSQTRKSETRTGTLNGNAKQKSSRTTRHATVTKTEHHRTRSDSSAANKNVLHEEKCDVQMTNNQARSPKIRKNRKGEKTCDPGASAQIGGMSKLQKLKISQTSKTVSKGTPKVVKGTPKAVETEKSKYFPDAKVPHGRKRRSETPGNKKGLSKRIKQEFTVKSKDDKDFEDSKTIHSPPTVRKKGKNAHGVTIKEERVDFSLKKEHPVMGCVGSPPWGGESSGPSGRRAGLPATMDQDDSDSESDWEEVEDIIDDDEAEAEMSEDAALKSQLPSAPIEITLQAPNIMKDKRQKKFDMEDWFRKQINRHKKESQLDLHKVHLMCLVSRGLTLNKLCNAHVLWAVALSVVPQDVLGMRAKRWDVHLGRLVRWFKAAFAIDADVHEDTSDWEATLIKRYETKRVASELELVLVFVTASRAVGLDARLVYSLQPVSFKPTDLKVKKSDGRKDKDAADNEDSQDASCSSKVKVKGKQSKDCKVKASKPQQQKSHSRLLGNKELNKSQGQAKVNGIRSEVMSRSLAKNRISRKSAAKVNYADVDSEGSAVQVEECSMKGKGKGKGKGKRSGKSPDQAMEISSDEEFEPNTQTFRSPSSCERKGKGQKKQKIVSPGSDESVKIVKSSITEKGTDYWAEVYLDSEQKWVCVDCVRARINHPAEMASQVTNSLTYVLGYDNSNHIKDITRRYDNEVAHQSSRVRRRRVEAEWWQETLAPYGPQTAAQTERDALEDLQWQAQLTKKPMPTSVGQFKGHSLYALKRHLLKFEAIYPETSLPLGYIHSEQIYARECVHTLHTRETWLKEGLAVRLGEQPYKIVKARKKMNKPQEGNEEPMVAVYGRWQTEVYIPLPAVDGKVPRNEYGNVELFKPSMLPGGTVHLQLPGLNRIAKKLSLDCVPAMMGWDFHGGWNHPILDGFIVCEEHKDVLIAAWDEDQEIQKQREAEKKEKRVLHNWRLMVKSLLIKERLKKQFNLQEPETSANADSSGKPGQKAEDATMAWPRNRQEEKSVAKGKKSNKKKQEQSACFPFEMEEM